MKILVIATGPIFDRRADAITDRICDNIAEAVAQRGYDLVQARLPQVLRNPTGNYQSHIAVDRAFQTRIINDSDIIYGPWLEGVGSRNKTTRFKGYATFRLMGQQLETQAPAIARSVLNREIGAL